MSSANIDTVKKAEIVALHKQGLSNNEISREIGVTPKLRPHMMMHLTSSKAYYRPQPVPKVPAGLMELMEEMTREVLKHNPTDIYEFCANDIEQLLVLRDGKAPKRHNMLTLDQKIISAQGKVKESAEQRRRLHDRAIKNISSEATPGTSSDKDTAHIVANTNQVREPEETSGMENPVLVEVNSFMDVIEGKPKAPVHHEKELTDALEVEIFHKSLENGEIKENKVNTEQNILKATFEMLKSVEETVLQTDEDIKGSTGTDTINAVDLKIEESNLELKLANEAEGALQDQIRVRRSVQDEESIDIQQDCKQTEIEAEPNTNIKSVQERSEINLNRTNTDEVSNMIVSVVSSADYVTNTTDIYDQVTEIASPENCDEGATFTDEIIENVSTLDQENLNIDFFVSKNRDGADSTALGVQSELIFESSNILVLDDHPERSQVEHHKSMIISHVMSPFDEDNATNIDTEHPEKIIESTAEESLNTNELDNTQKNISSADNKKYSGNVSNELSSVEKEKTCYDNVESRPNKHLTLQDVKEVVKQESVNKNKIDIHHAENNMKDISKEGLSKGTNVAIETVLPYNVPVTVESSSKNGETSGPLKNIDTRSSAESCDPEASASLSRVATVKEILYNEQKSIINVGTSETITTVDKTLMEEPAILKEDNDSVPLAMTESETKSNNGTEYTSGIHASNEETENDRETPEPRITKFFQKSLNETVNSEKRDGNGLDIQDNASTAFEVHRSDISPMEERSSMKENVLEESIASNTEVEVIHSDSEKDKENQTAMDLEIAAVTIQKVFRSFLFKKSTFDDTGIEEANSTDDDTEKVKIQFPVTTTPIKERRTLGISRMDTVLQTVNEEKSLSLSTDDSSLSSAATIIQAHIKGFLVRNRLCSNRTNSASLGKSEGRSISLKADHEQKANKTILNIHIVPEGENFISRDESLLTSMELSLDGSPPSLNNLHPLGYDKSEPRKQLKREDAIQSISPPSNNSEKLSEDVDIEEQQRSVNDLMNKLGQDVYTNSRDTSPTKTITVETVIEAHKISRDSSSPDSEKYYIDAHKRRKRSLEKAHSDESDVVCEDKVSTDSDNTLGLLHSGEFHDIVLPTKVSRADTTVVRGE